jgi:UDP-glucose 4-epimerase
MIRGCNNTLKKKIIVFGATGNVGKYFIKHLVNNINFSEFEIIATGRKSNYDFPANIKYINVDITNNLDFQRLPTNNIYSVVTFAGLLPAYASENNPYDYVETNILGTLNILEYCRKVSARQVIYMQTWADLNGYLKEKLPLAPYSPYKPIYSGDHAVYATTKTTGMELVKCYSNLYNMSACIFRLPNIYLYSPDKYYYVNGEKKLISYRFLIDRAIKGEPLELWGDESCGKDIIYVKDLCQMIYLAIFSDKKFAIYNAGTGIKTTMREQIEGIIEVFSPKENKSVIIEKPEMPNCDDFVMDISNIKEDLGYEPQYDYISYLKDYKAEMENDTKK